MESFRHLFRDQNQNKIVGEKRRHVETGEDESGSPSSPSMPIPIAGDEPFSPMSPRPSHPTSLSRLSSNIYIASSCPSYQPESMFAATFLSRLDEADNSCFVYKTFMNAHSCYDIGPAHAKVIAIDIRMPITMAWKFLSEHAQRSALLWDDKKDWYVGMLTITDFIRVYLEQSKNDPSGERLKFLVQQPIESWLKLLDDSERPQELLRAKTSDTLYSAVESLCSNEIHRLPITEGKEVVFMATPRNLLKFIHAYMNVMPVPDFMAKTPMDLGIGTWYDIWTVHEWLPLIEVLRLLMKENISAVPVVYDDGHVRAFRKSDLITVASQQDFDLDLTMPVRDALDLCGKTNDRLFVFATNEPLKQIIETVVSNSVHLVYITDQGNEIIAAISLTDILKRIVLTPDSPNSSKSSMQLNLL